MRPLVVLALLLILATASYAQNSSYNITFNYTPPVKHFRVTINVSEPHNATYTSWFNRPRNITINYSKIPRIELAPKPDLRGISDIHYDVVRNQQSVTLDPRTCPNNLAYCYQVIENIRNTTNQTRNLTRFSTYILPEQRIRTFVCVGNDSECVQSATNCYCPTKKVPPPPQVSGQAGRCSSTTHICLTAFGTFATCVGNLTSCQKQYAACGCGTAAACPSKRNTCLNTRDQLVSCKGTLSDCLGQYETCFCGPDMMMFQNACTRSVHQCTTGRELTTCYGAFATCALRHDKCEC
jgi:hypothetical protein